MKRGLFTLLSILSLACCVAVMVIGVRSYFRCDRGFICGPVDASGQSVLDFWSERGWLTAELTLTDGLSLGSPPRHGSSIYSSELHVVQRRKAVFGFLFKKSISYRTYDYTTKVPPRDTRWTMVLPHWFVVLLLAVLPAIFIVKWRRRRRAKAKQVCGACGYDVRASKDKCPECGAAIEPTSGA